MEPHIIFGQKVPDIIYQGLPEGEEIFILKVEPDSDDNLKDSNVIQKLPLETPPVNQREWNNELKKQTTLKCRSLIECRTCLEKKNQSDSSNISNVLFNFTVTIKEMLILCIPIMAQTLKNEDFICNPCLEELKLCYHFVDKCLKAEEKLKSFEETIKIVFEQDSDEDSSSPDNVNDINMEEGDDIKMEDVKPVIQNAETDSVTHGQKKDYIKYEVGDNLEDLCYIKSIQSDDLSQKNTNLICGICHKQFSRRYRLKKHLKIHEKKQRQCPVCSEKLSGIKNLHKHLARNHKGVKLYSCEKCNQKFSTNLNLKRHQDYYVYTSNCRFECSKCNKGFKSLDVYKKHLKDIQDAPVCNFLQCATCSVKFTKDDFREHVKIHPNDICPECGKSFTDKQALRNHKVVHGNPNRFICEVCGKGSKTLKNHTDHLKTHEPHEKERPFACTKCSKKFTHLYKLELHNKQHENIRNFHCTECDKKFCTPKSLNAHKKLIHTQHNKRYWCDICEKTFGRIDYLRRHMRHHTGEPVLDKGGKEIKNRLRPRVPSVPFKFSKNDLNKTCICKYCKKKIILKNLSVHYQMHLRIRKFKCRFCELIFTKYNAMFKHEKLHSDPNYQFRCKICYKKHTSQEELQAHMAAHHTKQAYQCNICSEPFGRKYLLENHKEAAHQNEEEMMNKSAELVEALKDVTFLDES